MWYEFDWKRGKDFGTQHGADLNEEIHQYRESVASELRRRSVGFFNLSKRKKKTKTKKLSSFEVFDAVESRGFLRKWRGIARWAVATVAWRKTPKSTFSQPGHLSSRNLPANPQRERYNTWWRVYSLVAQICFGHTSLNVNRRMVRLLVTETGGLLSNITLYCFNLWPFKLSEVVEWMK